MIEPEIHRKQSLLNYLMKTVLRKHSYSLLPPPSTNMMIKYDIPLPNFTKKGSIPTIDAVKGNIPVIDSIDIKNDKNIWQDDEIDDRRYSRHNDHRYSKGNDHHLYAEINKRPKSENDPITDDPRHLYAEVNKLAKTSRRSQHHLYEEINSISDKHVFCEDLRENSGCEGFLYVQNRNFWRLPKHAWKKKYFTLRNNSLYMTDSENDALRESESIPIGLDTGIYPIDNDVASGMPRFSIRITTGKQTYTLGSMEADDRDTWVTSLLTSMSNALLSVSVMSPSTLRRDGD